MLFLYTSQKKRKGSGLVQILWNCIKLNIKSTENFQTLNPTQYQFKSLYPWRVFIQIHLSEHPVNRKYKKMWPWTWKKDLHTHVYACIYIYKGISWSKEDLNIKEGVSDRIFNGECIFLPSVVFVLFFVWSSFLPEVQIQTIEH